jgi:hypothetical protein
MPPLVVYAESRMAVTSFTLREGFTGLQNPVTLKDKWE